LQRGKQDLFDGLLLGGTAKQIKTIASPKSARLGLLAYKVASNATTDTSLGDAAIALGADGRLGVTWVERAATAAGSDPSRVMFRALGPKLCD
jgi:hypothetical protein